MSTETKTFLQAVEEEKKNLKKKSFSKSTFISLFVTYINDQDHVMKRLSYSENEQQIKEILRKPVKEFRQAITSIIGDFVGNDADKMKDIESKMAGYKFKKSDFDFIYDFMSEYIYQYLKSGRKLRLFDAEDVSASISLAARKAGIKDSGNGKFVKTEDHYVLAKTSSCPPWAKSPSDEKGAIKASTLKRVVEKVFND